ncbi:hypothetical protein GQ53DRAFT_794307 [Thozetella sp. PMI_491]|nr:hypothetical protein GQ53DRAFT_794307 [Thozetella sp. PMI_491]
MNYIPQYFAERHGFFREQELDFTETVLVPWDGVLDGLVAEKADMAFGGIWVPSMYCGQVGKYTAFANCCSLVSLKRGSHDGFKPTDVAGNTVLMKSGGSASVGFFFKVWLRKNRDLNFIMLCNLFQCGMVEYFVTNNLSAREMVTQGDIPWSVYYGETATITSELLEKQRWFCTTLAKGIDRVLKNDPEIYRDELAELFPKVPVDAAVVVTNPFRQNRMWTMPFIS